MRTPSKSAVVNIPNTNLMCTLIRLNCTYTFLAIDNLCSFVYKIYLYKFGKGKLTLIKRFLFMFDLPHLSTNMKYLDLKPLG